MAATEKVETRAALPTEAAARKNVPVYSGFLAYFPLAIAAVAELSRIGNDQHNPGKPLHWDRSKSGDELDAQARHLLDNAAGVPVDSDGVLHLTKNAWRSMAALQKALEPAASAAPVIQSYAWQPWDGGGATDLVDEVLPCSQTAMVQVRYDDGDTEEGVASGFAWWYDQDTNIVEWRYAPEGTA